MEVAGCYVRRTRKPAHNYTLIVPNTTTPWCCSLDRALKFAQVVHIISCIPYPTPNPFLRNAACATRRTIPCAIRKQWETLYTRTGITMVFEELSPDIRTRTSEMLLLERRYVLYYRTVIRITPRDSNISIVELHTDRPRGLVSYPSLRGRDRDGSTSGYYDKTPRIVSFMHNTRISRLGTSARAT